MSVAAGRMIRPLPVVHSPAVALNKATFPVSLLPEIRTRLPDGIDTDRSLSTGWPSTGDSKVSSS